MSAKSQKKKKKYEFADHVEMYNSRNVIIIKVDHTKADDMRETYVRKRKKAKRKRRKEIKKERWA